MRNHITIGNHREREEEKEKDGVRESEERE
jgi:hypothetical protein